MNKKCIFLAAGLIVSGVVVGVLGLVIKFAVLAPYGIYQDRTAISLPFILMRDEGLQYMLSHPVPQPSPSLSPMPTESEALPTLPENEPSVPVDPVATVPAEDVLADVLFIGDSRTCSLRDHARIDGADYFCDVGMSVFNVEKKTLSDEGFQNQSLKELLARQEYSCVTISLGLNEAGYPIGSLISAYRELLANVVRTQPQAVIVLQGILAVGRNWAASTPYATPNNLAQINCEIAAMADDYRIFYIDPNERFADSEGFLPDSMTWDGCHLYAKDTHLWSQWFCDTVKEIRH